MKLIQLQRLVKLTCGSERLAYYENIGGLYINTDHIVSIYIEKEESDDYKPRVIVEVITGEKYMVAGRLSDILDELNDRKPETGPR